MSQFALFEDLRPAAGKAAIDGWELAHQIGTASLYLGDCLEVLAAMGSCSADAGVTDPPYGIGFMGEEWDTFDPDTVEANTRKAYQMHRGFNIDEATAGEDAPANIRGRQRSPAMSPSQIQYDRSLEGQRAFQTWCESWARELFRVLKPGGHLVVCGAPRSAHRMVSGIEDAGFEIRDSLAWLFGQGFPKSTAVERHVARLCCTAGGRHFPRKLPKPAQRRPGDHVCAMVGESAIWDGWGTALKPGHEPICLARKPPEGTIGENLRKWGVGALSIERSRIELPPGSTDAGDGGEASELGRWPTNVAIDAEAAQQLDAQAGRRSSSAAPTTRRSKKFRRVFNDFPGDSDCAPGRGASAGGASRFFFVPKPSRLERDFGCDDLELRTAGECTKREDGSAGLTPYAGAGRSGGGRNFHPTVKPIGLMRWLIGLVTPPGGVVVDPFFGSGTTGIAAVVDGYVFKGIDRDPEYLTLGAARIAATVYDGEGPMPVMDVRTGTIYADADEADKAGIGLEQRKIGTRTELEQLQRARRAGQVERAIVPGPGQGIDDLEERDK